MIKHKELKEKITEAEKKLQNMYQLEIKTDIIKLNDDTAKRNLELLDIFLSKFAEFKAELERSAAKRGDDHDAELKTFVASFDIKLKKLQELYKTSNESHSENYKILLSLSNDLQEYIAKIDKKNQEIENKLDFAIKNQ